MQLVALAVGHRSPARASLGRRTGRARPPGAGPVRARRAGSRGGRARLGPDEIQGPRRPADGPGPQEGDPGKAGDLWRRLGVRIVDNRAGLIDKAESSSGLPAGATTASASAATPQPATRQAILGVTKASFPGFEVVDRTTLRAACRPRRLACGRQLRTQAAHIPQAWRRPLEGPRPLDPRRDRGCRQLPRREAGVGNSVPKASR